MSPGDTGTEASTVIAAIDGEDTDDTAVREDNNSPSPKQDDNLTLNEVWEMLFGLMRKSTILDECCERVGRAITKSVAAHATELYKPFTGYISDVASEVNMWHTKVLLIHPKIIDCDYDAYCRYSAQIREKTNGFYQRGRMLGKTLDHRIATNRSSKGNHLKRMSLNQTSLNQMSLSQTQVEKACHTLMLWTLWTHFSKNSQISL